MTEGAAKWGGWDAPTTYTGFSARCLNCGSFTALILQGDDFVCRDQNYCEARTRRRNMNTEERKRDEESIREFLERLRRS